MKPASNSHTLQVIVVEPDDPKRGSGPGVVKVEKMCAVYRTSDVSKYEVSKVFRSHGTILDIVADNGGQKFGPGILKVSGVVLRCKLAVFAVSCTLHTHALVADGLSNWCRWMWEPERSRGAWGFRPHPRPTRRGRMPSS